MKYGNYNAAAEEMVDISSGYGAGAAPMRYTPAQNGGNKNKILIISIVAAIAVALTVAGFCIFSALHQEGDDGKLIVNDEKYTHLQGKCENDNYDIQENPSNHSSVSSLSSSSDSVSISSGVSL